MFHPSIKSKEDEDISILIQIDNHAHNYICECGYASELTVKECQNTQAIFLSHTHIDHFIHFDFILRHQIGIQKRVVICGPEGIIEQLQAKIKAYQWNLIEEDAIVYEVRAIKTPHLIEVAELRPPLWQIENRHTLKVDTVYKNERFEVFCTILDHKTDLIAYLFKEKDSVNINMNKTSFKGGQWIASLKEAYQNNEADKVISIEGKSYLAQDLFHLLELKKGDTLGVVMDHAPHEDNHRKIKSLFHKCNKVFIESFYKETDKDFAIANAHSYASASAKVMLESEVKEPIPVHFSRKYTKEQILELKREFYSLLH